MIERQKPIKHEEIAITPVELQVTSKGDQFLAGNSGPDGKTVITFVSGDDQALTRREGIKPGMACKRDSKFPPFASSKLLSVRLPQ